MYRKPLFILKYNSTSEIFQNCQAFQLLKVTFLLNTHYVLDIMLTAVWVVMSPLILNPMIFLHFTDE